MFKGLERLSQPRMDADASPTLSTQARSFAMAELSSVRIRLIQRIWIGIVVLAVIGVPVSVSRASVTGWLPMYTAHILIGCTAIGIFLLGQRLPLAIRTWAIFLLFGAVGLVGILQLGPFGAGLWWLATCPFLAAAIFSIRAGYFAMLALAALLLVVGTLYTSGVLVTDFDSKAYGASVQAWATLAIGACLMPLVVFQGISLFTRQVVELAVRQHHYETQLEEQRDRLQALAFKDELTGAETRRVMLDRMEQRLLSVQRSGERSALIMVDLDDFKPINDLYGHAVGDDVLKAIYERMRGVLRPSDSIARFGGDEFVLLIDLVKDLEEALAVGERIAAAIGQPISTAGQRLQLRASLGVTVMPDQGITTQALLERADAAMYEAKRNAKSGGSSVRLTTVTPIVNRHRHEGFGS